MAKFHKKLARGNKEDVGKRPIDAAHEAFKDMSKTSPAERSKVLKQDC